MSALTRDTPEIDAMRQELLENDYRMRDLAYGPVATAYKEAAQRFPETQAEPAEAVAAPEAEAPPEAPVTAPEPVPATPEPAPPPSVPQPPETNAPPDVVAAGEPAAAPINIAADVSQKLVAAGRPAEEADAAGALLQSYYETRAARFEGTKGTGADLYRAEGPDIRGGRNVSAKAPEFAQKGRELEQGERSLSDVTSAWDAKGISHAVSENDRAITVSKIVVPEGARKQGVGTAAMQELTDYADEVGKRIELSPSTDFGATSKARLERFYKQFGFEKNTGRARDFTTRETMIREPAGRDLAQTTKGKIRLGDARAVITLMKTADASTFIHETGHQWLEDLLSDARDARAPAGLTADAGTVRKWLGAEGDVTTRQHEKFARGFETYMMEGRAPSTGLARVFAQFKSWLTSIYQTVAKLRSPISDNIRDVFDRMLATNPDERPVIASDKEFVTPARREPVYEKVPKEPLRLVNFLRKSFTDKDGLTASGGLRDPGGDLNAIAGGPKGRPGLINNETGQHLDDAALRAWEAGYFPGEERPDINRLLDAIREDISGNPQYSEHDHEAVQAFHDAMESNSEIDRLADQHGINPKGLTREQFFDAVRVKMDNAAAEAEIESLAKNAGALHGEADEVAQDHEAERGGAEALYGEPRTLEDLERENRQAHAAPAAVGLEGGDAERGAPGGGEAAGEGGARQGGRGTGPVGRAGPEQGGGLGPDIGDAGIDPRGTRGQPRPGESVGPYTALPDESDLVDKAGNIRLDNLNAPDDVKQALRDLAAQNNDFLSARGGGPIPDAQRRAMADALGLNIKNFDPRRPADVSPSVWAEAVQKLTFDTMSAVSKAEDKFKKSGAPEDAAAYLQMQQRFYIVADHFAGLTAEAGRSLRVFNKAGLKFGEGFDLASALQDETGKTLYQMQRQAQLGSMLPTTAQKAKFLQDARRPDFLDKALFYWTNGLISGPITHATYLVGNVVQLWTEAVPETLAAGVSGLIARALGREGGRYGGEVGAAVHGILQGQRNGIVAGWEAIKSGATQELPGENGTQGSLFAFSQASRNPFESEIGRAAGEVIGAPSRGVAAIHSYNRAIVYSREISQAAYRQATEEGLEGEAFNTRVADLTMNPTQEMMDAAITQASETSLMGKGGNLINALSQFTNKVRLLKFIMPFVRVGGNITRQALLERTALGFIDQGIRDNLLGRNGAVAQDTQIGRIAVGSAIGATTIGMAAQGLITGSEPLDPKLAAAWRLAGKQPYSARLPGGSTWFSYKRLGTYGTFLSIAADLYHLGDAISQGDAAKVGSLMISSVSHDLLDDSWMKGPSDLLKAISDQDGFGKRYVRDMATSFLPFSVGASQIARMVDPYMREARSMVDAIRAKIPFLSEELLPRRDIWGAPIPNRLGLGGFTAIYTSDVSKDPVNQKLLQLEQDGFGVFPSQPERRINNVKLTDQQYDDYTRVAGIMLKARLDNQVNTPGFSQMPEGLQAQHIRDTTKHAREAAEKYVRGMSVLDGTNSIPMQAAANKRAALLGTGPHP